MIPVAQSKLHAQDGLMRDYADGRLEPSQAPPQRGPSAET